MDDSKREQTVVERFANTALVPFHAATSKPAQKAYLGTFLFTATSLLLFCISTVAYVLFYYNYVPQNSVERVVYLQFGEGNPWGVATLSSSLTSLQAYDVFLSLHLPRTPSNIRTGNFMLDVSLLAPGASSFSRLDGYSLHDDSSVPVLARSRRPAIMTYTSPIVSAAHTLCNLPFHVLGFKKESEDLEVGMFEGVEFAKGWANVPQSVMVVVEANEKMQFYNVGVHVIAKLGGLRWILYHHRILSFLFFTTSFWSISMLSMLFVWFILSSYFAPAPESKEPGIRTRDSTVEREHSDSDSFDPSSIDDLSDTSRTFPTSGRQLPLHFAGRKDVKKEEQEAKDDFLRSTDIQPLIAEADDEGEEAIDWKESGIGTGRDEERLASVQRRRKALFGGGALGSN